MKFNHGPLLEGYFLWGDGQKLVDDFDHTHGDTVEMKKKGMSKYDFISEGDSPSYLYLVDVGLRSTEDASYGGWGGRMVKSASHKWQDGDIAMDFNPTTQKDDKAYPQTRWIDVMQNDFAARADWCVKSYKDANHAPIVKLDHSNNLSAVPARQLS
ncbi:MAG: nucleoside hydrolase-like domain-containing protein [Bacteroidota bacterium]